MSYINRDDIQSVVGDDQLSILEIDNPNLINELAPIAESYILNHASALYDFSLEFARTGNDRNAQLKQIAVSIVSYYAYQQVASDQIPDIRVKAYDDAMDSLIKARKGTMYFYGVEVTEPNSGRSKVFGKDESSAYNEINY